MDDPYVISSTESGQEKETASTQHPSHLSQTASENTDSNLILNNIKTEQKRPAKLSSTLKCPDLKDGNKASVLPSTAGKANFHISLPIDSPSSKYSFTKSCDFSRDLAEPFQHHAKTIARSLSEGTSRQCVSNACKNPVCRDILPNLSGRQCSRSISGSLQCPRSGSLRQISASGQAPPWKVRFSSEKRWICFCLCLVNFSAFLSMSIIAPFFPGEAKQKGMRESVSGFVFSIYAFVVMVSSPIFGKLLPSVGAKSMLLLGIGFCGVCNILFGFLDNVEGQMAFTLLCFAVRSFEALGAAAFGTASYTILIDQFPYDIGTVFGFMETCIGVGQSIGPAIGGGLYTIGGFGLPFFTLGGCVISIVPICYFLLHNVKNPSTIVSSNVSYKRLLMMPHVIIVCLIVAVASQSQGFISPTLEPHMEQYGLDASVIGLLFLVLSAAYTISSPVIGLISGRVSNKYPIMIIGLLMVTISLLLLGPSEILPFKGSLQLSILSLTMLGISFAFAYVPTFESMFIAAINGGLKDDINTYSIVSGLWNSMYSLGEVTGPLLGGVLSDYFAFPTAATIIGFCTLAAFGIAAIAWANPCQCFGPYSLIEGAAEKVKSKSLTEKNDPSIIKTPLSGTKHQSYGTLKPDKTDPSRV